MHFLSICFFENVTNLGRHLFIFCSMVRLNGLIKINCVEFLCIVLVDPEFMVDLACGMFKYLLSLLLTPCLLSQLLVQLQ